MKNNGWCLDQKLKKGGLLWEDEENEPQSASLPEPRMRDGCSLKSSGSDLQHWHSRDKFLHSVQACDSRDLNPSQSSQQLSWTPAEPGRWEGWVIPLQKLPSS